MSATVLPSENRLVASCWQPTPPTFMARGMNLGIEDALLFPHCVALQGDLNRLADYGTLRRDVHGVVAGVDMPTRLARSRLALLAQ
jgi:2-polyprenyl-6-methoxyphenol hydroxylase-like FAD-dependent oxidoreductase